jgi:hypothetical protein
VKSARRSRYPATLALAIARHTGRARSQRVQRKEYLTGRELCQLPVVAVTSPPCWKAPASLGTDTATGGAARTTAVNEEAVVREPATFVAVTTTRSFASISPGPSSTVAEDAPAIAAHADPSARQRSHP